MSQKILDTDKDEENYKKLEKIYRKTVQLNDTIISHTIEKQDGNITCSVLSIALGAIFLIVGCFGLYFKVKESSTRSTAKLVKSSTSVWCIITGILLPISEVVKYSAGNLGAHVGGINDLVQKLSVLALKNHTIILYTFQTAMIFRPFFFREHSKCLAKLLVGVTLTQWLVTICAPLAWGLIFVFSAWDDCVYIKKVNEIWLNSFTALIGSGYIGSFILSMVYVVGYYKKNKKSRKNVGSAQKISIKQTLVACSVEIVYDLAGMAHELHNSRKCLPILKDLTEPLVQSFDDKNSCNIKMDTTFRIEMLDWNVTRCTLWVMVIQQLVQEIVFLVNAIGTWCRAEE